MIRELQVRDLVVIERAGLEPAPGLTAVTGETGAGKTVFTQALGLLAGVPVDASAVRPGAHHALVEATLALPQGFWDRLDEDDPALTLRELVEDEREVVVGRRVPAQGRARALIDGQTAARDAVAALVRHRVRFSAQHDHRRLVSPATQLAILDAFAGSEARASADRLATLRRRIRADERAVAAARGRRDAAARDRAQLEALVADVEDGGLSVDDELSLRAERERLDHAAEIAQAVARAAEALAPGEGDGGAVAQAGIALAALEGVERVDADLGGPRDDISGALASLQEAVLYLRGYLTDLDADPTRLERVEERLDLYRRLCRRHGIETAALVERAQQAQEVLAALDAGDEEVAGLEADLAASRDEARGLAAALLERRREAAPRLAEAVRDQLADLGMARAELRIEVGEGDGDPPVGTCVIWLRANPGLAEAPLAATASGGELSRVLLALHGVAAAGDDSTWLMDEVDAGIGGVTATAVGARLRAMARGRQVIVITHLPQVAAMADRHHRLVKGVDGEGRATTQIEPLDGEAVVGELCRMPGASPDDQGARRHAEELLARRGD